MANVLNLLSESTYIEKMDTQNALLTAIALQSGDSPVEISSWITVQQLVRLGIADKVFNIGDQLICNHKAYGPLTWDIIGIDIDIPTNSEYQHSLTIQLHDCVQSFAFDAAEPTNPDQNRRRYGSNNWVESNIRQWLNSDKIVNTWWEPQTEYDTAPWYASYANGFLYGLDTDFLAVVGEVFKDTALNTVTDGGSGNTSKEKFFLLSQNEVFGGPNGDIPEGISYPYYADDTLAGPGYNSTIRIKYRNGTAKNWWLRSPVIDYSYGMRLVGTSGEIRNNSANNDFDIAPACCIV